MPIGLQRGPRIDVHHLRAEAREEGPNGSGPFPCVPVRNEECSGPTALSEPISGPELDPRKLGSELIGQIPAKWGRPAPHPPKRRQLGPARSGDLDHCQDDRWHGWDVGDLMPMDGIQHGAEIEAGHQDCGGPHGEEAQREEGQAVHVEHGEEGQIDVVGGSCDLDRPSEKGDDGDEVGMGEDHALAEAGGPRGVEESGCIGLCGPHRWNIQRLAFVQQLLYRNCIWICTTDWVKT